MSAIVNVESIDHHHVNEPVIDHHADSPTHQAKSSLADVVPVECSHSSAGPSKEVIHTQGTDPYPGFVSSIHVPYHVYHRHHSHPYPCRAKSQSAGQRRYMQRLSSVDEAPIEEPIHFSSQSNGEAPPNPTDAPT